MDDEDKMLAEIDEEFSRSCECCNYVFDSPEEVKIYGKPAFSIHKDVPTQFCKLCATTLTSNTVQYPNQYAEEGLIMRTMAYMANSIIQEIRKGKTHG